MRSGNGHIQYGRMQTGNGRMQYAPTKTPKFYRYPVRVQCLHPQCLLITEIPRKVSRKMTLLQFVIELCKPQRLQSTRLDVREEKNNPPTQHSHAKTGDALLVLRC